ncbi:MAG: HEAT repeat domain-containing protein, partial [Bacteroidota bacterium]
MFRKILVWLFFVFLLLGGMSVTLFAQSKKVQENIEDLKSASSSSARWEAAWNLGQIGDSSAVEPLTETLADDRRYVREAAVVALGKIGDSRSIKPLIKTLSGDNDPNVRMAAA